MSKRRREMFVPLTHPPGHAQVDFGEALAVIGGVERKIHFLAMSLPHSDACFVKAYPGETTEAFCDGHVSGFSFFGGVPRSILYDNTRIAVARILGDGKRQRTRVFSELRSHLFEDRFGRPGKGNDKGKVEGIVGYCRRNFLVPMPRSGTSMISTRILKPAAPSDGRNNCVATTRRSANAWNGIVRFFSAFPQSPTTPATSARGGQFAVAGALSRHRLLRPHTVRPLRGAGPACPRGGHQLRRQPGTRVHTSKRTSSSIRCTICPLEQKTNALDQAAPLAGWLLPPVFGCRLLEARWAKPGSGNTSRCF